MTNKTPNGIVGREADPMSYQWQVSLQWKEQNPMPDHLRSSVPEKEMIDYHL